MKIILKEWLKSPSSCVYLLIYVIVAVVYTFVDAELINQIGSVFESNEQYMLIQLIITALLTVILAAASNALLPIARMHCFTEVHQRWDDTILQADYDMFTKISPAGIYTAGEFMWKVTEVGIDLVRAGLQVITIGIFLWEMWQLANSVVLPVIAIYLIAILIFRVIYRKLSSLDANGKQLMKKRNQESENTIYGFLEVRSFHTERRHHNSLYEYNQGVKNAKLKKSKMIAILHGGIELLEKASIIIVILFCISMVNDGTISQAIAMSLVLYSIRILNPVMWMLDFADELSEEISLADEYAKIINWRNKNSDEGTIRLNDFTNSIEIKNLSFAYEDSSNALSDISLTIRKGEHIGICGESGGGKSTLFKLMNRFYKPSEGKIFIDGINIQDITKDSYCATVGAVHQDNTIFPGTIKENILYGVGECLEAELIDAAKKAYIYDFIMSLPDKFNTEVGPRGLKLSGGQKQRIALARLFLKNPKIILLDEATSALDNESETMIERAIAESDATVITIAHRLSTIKNCDQIFVVDQHRIAEHGTHDELMKLNGIYAHMQK